MFPSGAPPEVPASSKVVGAQQTLKFAAPPLLLDVLRRPKRKRHDRERGILLAGGGETASVGHEEIFHFARLAKAVQDGGLGIFAHADCAHFMTGKAAGGLAGVWKSLAL